MECFKRLLSDFICITYFHSTFLMRFIFYAIYITKQIANFLRATYFRIVFVCIHIISFLTLPKRFKEYISFCRKQSRFRSIKGPLSSTLQDADSIKFHRKPNQFNSTQRILGSILRESDSLKFYRKPS